MRRVVVTGLGIVSSIGNNTQEVLASLREAESGIVRAEKYAELGFRSQVHGAPTLDPERNASIAAPCAFMPAAQAGTMSRWIRRSCDAGLTSAEISHERTGMIMGSGGPSTRTHRRGGGHRAHQGTRRKSGLSRCRRPCPRPPRRRSRPGSRSRASTIRSRRPARPPIIALATPLR